MTERKQDTKSYNPLDHSVVQAMVGTWCAYQCDNFVEAIFDKVLEEVKRVHWNVYQHEWKPTWHGDEIEDPEIPGISFVRYYCDRCDCGGQAPQHTDDCAVTRLHPEWNKRRLDAISDPSPDGFGRLLDFSAEREAKFRAVDPRPVCSCGADDAFDEDRGCLPTCIGQKPNFQHEDVEFRWYKWPGRDMSTNKDWTAQEWRDWLGRCLATVRAFDIDHLSEKDHERTERLRESMRERFPKAYEF